MEQLTARDLVLAGLVAQAVLALLFALVWRSLRGGWPAWFALGFAANAAVYGAMAAGLSPSELFVAPSRLVALLALCGVVLMTIGVIDYVGIARRLALRLDLLAVGVALASIPLGVTGVITRASGHAVMAAYVLCWAWLFVRAMWREPHSGHGFVVLALVLYPVSVLAIVGGRLPAELLGASAVVPFSVLGATLLTTGLLRAQRRAALALAEREHAQALLRATNDSLEHQVALRTAELRETIDGLESFNRSVSHDLRGPLGGIVGVTRLARERLAGGDREQAQRLLDVIEEQAVNSVKLVEALLALSRASDATLHLREVDSGQLAADVIGSLPRELAQCCKLSGAMPKVVCDPELLRQVFSNLIGNAVKFANRSQHPRVEVAAQAVDGEEVFLVRDNGVGFDPAAAQRLFKPFQRLHDRSYEGFGVGLSIVKRIIDRHGGRVWAEGTPGQGASFYFTLGHALPDRA
ncbi:MAG TPA: ATP-binding protein [Burkholderiaceae bacterium]|nr:ATP-binding protein [Burkholderiaceae bacterium]